MGNPFNTMFIDRVYHESLDGFKYRTLGATQTGKNADVDASKITCKNISDPFNDYTGEKCWPWKLKGQVIAGKQLYLWLSTPAAGIKCGSNNTKGFGNCVPAEVK